MYKKNYQDISEQDFQRHNKNVACYYLQPSAKYPTKLNEFEKLVYVGTVFSQKPKNNFNHDDTSPFQPVIPSKK